jgi:methyltransferase (TIGR00027 family)
VTELPPVSRTALGVAGLRAYESLRPDRLIDDPYAAAFFDAGKALYPAPQPSRVPAEPGQALGWLFYSHVVVRTRFYDEYLAGAIAAGLTQVVLLAAGLDSRAFRLEWPAGTRLFELDLPGVLGFKDRVLDEHGARARCARVVVPVDLREDWDFALREAGFDPARPTAWLAEGLLIYLSFDEATRLLGMVGELSAPGSMVAFEHRTGKPSTLVEQALALDNRREVTNLWQGGLAKQGKEWLSANGWQPTAHVRPSLAQEHGRDTRDEPHGFVVAVRS